MYPVQSTEKSFNAKRQPIMSTFHLILALIYLSTQVSSSSLPYPDQKFRYIYQRDLFDPVKSHLNDSIIPLHYNVELVINEGNSYYGEIHKPDKPIPPSRDLRIIEYGKVRIYGMNQVNNSCTVIVHFKELEINESSVTVIGGAKKGAIPIKNTSIDKERHWYIIKLGEIINAGDLVQIYMEFRSTKYDKTDWGPRYSEYLMDNGLPKRYVTPNGGGFRKVMHDFNTRAVFPLFDEPHLQATFQLTVVRREGYRALSNTHVAISNVPDKSRPGFIKDKFQKTIKMSPHMFSFVVSDLPFMKVTTSQNKLIRFHAPNQILENAHDDVEYLTAVAARLFSFHDNFYAGSMYSPQKMDIVWRDSAHAKVGWGLYVDEGRFLLRESAHYQEMHDAPHYRQFILERISYPFAHQWHWHSKRELVKYMKLLGMEAVTPEYLWTGRHESMITCALQEQLVHDTGLDYARRHCDGAVHNTGGFGKYDVREVLLYRMLEGFVGRQTFRLGMQKFLENGPVYDILKNEHILLDSFEQAIRENNMSNLLPPNETSLAEVFNSWRERNDLTIVKVANSNASSCINISQERFHGHEDVFVDEHGKGVNGTTGLWMIPVRIVIGGEKGQRSSKETQLKVWLGDSKKHTCVPNEVKMPKWIKINNNATGYYRTLYDEELIGLIKEQLDDDYNLITPLTRSQLIDDYFYMAYAGKVSIQSALNLTRYMNKETDSAVWRSFLRHVAFLYNDLHIYRHPDYSIFQNYMKSRFHGVLHAIDLDEKLTDPASLIEFRQDLLMWACRFGNERCIQHVKNFLKTWEKNPELNPFTTSTGFGMVSLVGMAGGEEGFEFLLEEFFHPPSSESLNGSEDFVLRWKAAMMHGITQVTDTRLLERLLNYTLDLNSTLSSTHYFDSVYWDIRSNRVYRGILLDFLMHNADRIISHVKIIHNETEPAFAWFNLVQLIGATVQDEAELFKAKSFFKENDERFYESFKSSSKSPEFFTEVMDFDAWSSHSIKSLEDGRKEYSEAAGRDQRMKRVVKDIGIWLKSLAV